MATAGQPEEQRKIQRRVHPHEVGIGGSLTADEARDLLLFVVHLAEGEEVLLADGQSELAHGVAEQQSEVWFHVFQGVDAKAVDVEPRYQVLMRTDERIAHRKALA